ncbi:hypothetical protein AeMF1_013288 [Aphanomyces euteiches]|nr:hypothetical protein AeMF1_013288 [Aphanomyces euteiches]
MGKRVDAISPQNLPLPSGKRTVKPPNLTKEEEAEWKREDACYRKQKQRAREKAEREYMLATVSKLEKHVQDLKRRQLIPKVLLNALPFEIKAAVLENRKLVLKGRHLKKRVEELHEVISMLSTWVNSLKAHTLHPGMVETTLLGHPECRKFSHTWLCQRALNMALSASPYPGFLGKVEDNMISWPHLGEDNFGTSLEAIQLHSQYSVMGDYKDVAAVLWETYITSSPQHTLTVIDSIHDDLVYICVEYGPLKSKVLHVGAKFHLEHRMVVTLTTVAYDERFPMGSGESRLHGFSWMILDEMGMGVTLCRQSSLQYTPVNKERPLTLEEIGDLIHYKLGENEPRENVIYKFQDMIETSFIMQRDMLVRARFPIL